LEKSFSALTEVLEKIRREVTRKNAETTADDADFTDKHRILSKRSLRRAAETRFLRRPPAVARYHPFWRTSVSVLSVV